MRTITFKRKLAFLPLIVLAIFALSAVTMVLWNHLMPQIFKLPSIDFWQSAGLLILARLFFGGGPRGGFRDSLWRHKLREKMAKMSPEEREVFIENLQKHRPFWGRHEAGRHSEEAKNSNGSMP